MIIKEIQSEFKKSGIKKLEEDAMNWFLNAKKNPSDLSVSFCENQMMQIGKINHFNYNPKGKDTLDYYDKKPLVLSLGVLQKKKMRYEIGINLNFIPAPYKWFILEKIQSVYSGFFYRAKNTIINSDAYRQPQIMYKYSVIKSLLTQYGFEFALRVYIPSRKSKVYCINYNSWIKAAFLSLEKFEGITHKEMIRQYMTSKNK